MNTDKTIFEDILRQLGCAESMAATLYDAIYYSPSDAKCYTGAVHGLRQYLEQISAALTKAVFPEDDGTEAMPV